MPKPLELHTTDHPSDTPTYLPELVATPSEAPFWHSLEAHGDASALVSPFGVTTFTELAQLADGWAQRVRGALPAAVSRPLVMIEATNTVETVAAYVGALRAEWPVILTSPNEGDQPTELEAVYRPNVLQCAAKDEDFTIRSPEPAEMHPELAVLLSTSGSTGARKLVRLSRDNLNANANAIATYLDVRPDDVAATLLPFYYSYGLSVLHTHLLRGGTIQLVDAAVVDESFWATARAAGVTTLALVPTQLELLDKAGFHEGWLEQLRYVTQAGGRLDPTVARRFAERARDGGWRFYLMYGQTEASPRISFVPPLDAVEFCDSIGRPIPGGRLWLEDSEGQRIDDAGVRGELVYEGPNVMLGYARTREELSAPKGPSMLRTGDIAERLANGYFRIVGRTSRFLKIVGLRIGLDEVETALRTEDHRVWAAGSDQGLVLFLSGSTAPDAVRAQAAARFGLPSAMIRVESLAHAPLLPSGKVDRAELRRRALEILERPEAPAPGDDLPSVLKRALKQSSLDSTRSFRQHGGDSLAYLELELFLARRLRDVPSDWDRRPIAELAALCERMDDSSSGSGWQNVGVDLVGRVIAICAMITIHTTGLPTGGGSFLLLILTGTSLGRFQSSSLFEGRVDRALLSLLLPLLIPYYLLVAPLPLFVEQTDTAWLTLTANLNSWNTPLEPLTLEPYWFVSTYVQVVVLAALPFLIPLVRRTVARAPFMYGLIALGLLAAGLQIFDVAGIHYGYRHRHPIAAAELMAVGWCIAFANTPRDRVVLTLALMLVMGLGWYDVDAGVFLFIVGGALSVVWLRRVSLPSRLAQGAMLVGTLTLYIYLIHVPVQEVLEPLRLDGWLFLTLVLVASVMAAAVLKRLYDTGAGPLVSRLRSS